MNFDTAVTAFNPLLWQEGDWKQLAWLHQGEIILEQPDMMKWLAWQTVAKSNGCCLPWLLSEDAHRKAAEVGTEQVDSKVD